ncbi:MAG: hypothetical protein H0X37_11105 [Herpetosiphonaceae bacterium]|nr:hypothetical protein [Herpetosiphonaceae bacterium]
MLYAFKVPHTLKAAFIPTRLPPALVYDAALVLALSRADTALGELAGLGRQLPNPNLLIGPYVRREPVLSSRIEGTRTSLSELLLDEVDDHRHRPQDADLQEVRNYIEALEYGIQRLQEFPLSLRLVREIHARLMTGWLHFFLTGVTETAHTAVQQAKTLMDLREEFRARLRDKPKAQALLDDYL